MKVYLKSESYYFHSFDQGAAWTKDKAKARKFRSREAAERWLSLNSHEFLKYASNSKLPEIVEE